MRFRFPFARRWTILGYCCLCRCLRFLFCSGRGLKIPAAVRVQGFLLPMLAASRSAHRVTVSA